ncbi:hypothetical protein [Demequina maris]|uniref:hypothetical protein n=1 Tax=Demequina maris TaxID=1638982 RepID=UPI001E453FFB|nr:hypothetical protein [Demequina maris]
MRDVIQAGDWLLVEDGEAIDLPTALAAWDYQSNLRVRRIVELEPLRIRNEVGLPAHAPIVLSVIWSATGSNLSGPAVSLRLGHEVRERHVIEFSLRAADLGGTLSLRTLVALGARVTNAPETAPWRAGSILWMDTIDLRLQGDAAQFPMAVIDFAHTALPETAGWHLQITGGMETAAMGALLLLINSSHEQVVGAFEAASRPRPAQRAVLSAVRSDVARTLVEHALVRDDFDPAEPYPDGSLGATCADLFNKLFDGRSVTDVRLGREHSPGMFATELQAYTQLFQEP